MRVLHVDTARGWRGGQNQVLLTAQGMARRGHQVVVAARAGGPLAERAAGRGLDTRAIRFGGDLAPAPAYALRRLVRDFRPDVVHLHDPHAAGAALLIPRALTPLVASRRVDFAMRGPLSRWKYRRCRRVIAVSQAVARVLGQDGLSPEAIRVVYEGVPDRPPAPGGQGGAATPSASPRARRWWATSPPSPRTRTTPRCWRRRRPFARGSRRRGS